ncbi:MAG: hypothetical protein GQ475_06985 [Methylococcaceae bacterium]|nr:hypothetical protein [Methylococcaceae bacterium]
MISGATHTLSADLNKSMQNFRSQLDQQRSLKANDISKTQALVEKTEPSEEIESPQQPKKDNIDYDALNADIQSRRDSARQAAVNVTGLKHQQNMVDTYVAASSDDELESSSSAIEPVDVYKTSIEYSRRMDLISAFESVGQNSSNPSHISILV